MLLNTVQLGFTVFFLCALWFPHWNKQHIPVVTYDTAPSLPHLSSFCGPFAFQVTGGGRVCSSVGVSCQVGNVRCSVCHESYWCPHSPHIFAQEGGKDWRGASRGEEGRHGRDRGQITAGEDGRGGERTVISCMQIYRGGLRKNVCWRERERQTDRQTDRRATVRFIWEKQGERTMAEKEETAASESC